jgi:hypothetical protein
MANRPAARHVGEHGRVDPVDFVQNYPTLLHLADARSWPSIERHGLLSAAEIVRRWQVPPDHAEALLTCKRPEPVVLDHPERGVAVLRDQHPLREHLLAPALTDGMKVGDWLRLLNSFAFFFTSPDRLRALRSAYRDTPAVLLTVRTQSLVQAHGAKVRLAGMNTGNTSRKVKERGANTFLPIHRYDLRARVQEVVVMDEVSDLRDHLISAEMLPADD